LFSQSKDFCVIEKYGSIQRLIYFKYPYLATEEMILDSDHYILQINETSLLGWLEYKEAISK